ELEAVDQWLVSAGDEVEAGTELASLNEAETEEQRAIWESERDAVMNERSEVQSSLAELRSAREQQGSSSGQSETDRMVGETPEGEAFEIDVNVSVGVEVPQDGTFAAGIAQAEQRLAELDSRLSVLEAQLAQNLSNPALISPIEGVVAAIDQDSEPMSIEIYSTEKVLLTYALEREWQDVNEGDAVWVHVDGISRAMRGRVMSVAQIPSETSKWLEAYHELDATEQANPIAYYEVRVLTEETLEAEVPYGRTANLSIILEEAQEAVALPQPWIFKRYDTEGFVHRLEANGRASAVPVTVAFDVGGKAVLESGVGAGTIVLQEHTLRNFTVPPKVFMPFPIRQPDFELAKDTDWREYLEFLIAQ
ncbi:MAG TPA: efflux RND transporter periplasmic adaptor subunit, partial [Planococcus sp. (in: firmicutes)]|nr:efflux RND transporter periplasmic adaptor subunit [Planococcus sp. (in: firmicutes)]